MTLTKGRVDPIAYNLGAGSLLAYLLQHRCTLTDTGNERQIEVWAAVTLGSAIVGALPALTAERERDRDREA